MTIEVTDGDKVKVYTVKALDDLTLADWKAMIHPAILPEKMRDRLDAIAEVIKRCTGIPKASVRRLPVDQATAVYDACLSLFDQVKAEQEAADAAPDPIRSFVLDGVTYKAPSDIANGVTLERYSDLLALSDGVDNAADGMAAMLAVLFTPEFDEYMSEDVKERMALMLNVPLRTAFGACGPFIDSSEALRSWHVQLLTQSLSRTLSQAFRRLSASERSTASTA